VNAQIAAAVARRHGLTLGDAAALARLADTEDEADQLAAQFAAPSAPEPDDSQIAEQILARTRS
jgi:hypothetical protein